MSGAAAVGALGAAALVLAVHDAARQLRAVGTRRRWHRHAGDGPVAVTLPPKVAAALERAGVDDAPRAVLAWIGAVTLAAVLAVLGPAGRLVLPLVVVGPPVAVRLAQGRLARRRAGQLPDALDAIGAGLRGGLGLAGAIGGAAAVGPPLGPELAAIGRQVAAGLALDEAISRWRAASPDPATALAGAALGVAASVGGPGARAVDGAAASLRDRLAAEAEADALATQAKASAAVLTAAPLVFAALLTSLDPTAARFLLGTPLGWLCIAAGLGLDVAGACWMAALVRRTR
ncbi:MAG TPA: type II secretion system F family protein [Acidimicrobiales bacterium]|nr:type II secretion system F family protein [Acidimicrobiales bacterium]